MQYRARVHYRGTTAVAALLALIASACAGSVQSAELQTSRSAPAEAVSSLSASSWPGPMSDQKRAELDRVTGVFRSALLSEDPERLAEVIGEVRQILGPHLSVPGVKPEYGYPIDRTRKDLDEVIAVWMSAASERENRLPWVPEVVRQEEAAQAVSRLRISSRIVRAYLHSKEAGIDDAGTLEIHALAGLDYLLSRQASNGVFGYPYSPGSTGRVAREAAMIVEKARAQGIDMVENGFIVIDPQESGGLQFDNGMVGITLLYAYTLTGDSRYLESARQAGAWAMSNSLSTNFNYNCFAGYLLSRLYRVTGEQEYLDAAKRFMDLGVLPGQDPETGRWIDPHNARIQYHSVMIRAMVEYTLALKQAGDDKADFVETRTRLGLDNLARQISTFGASNAHELLSLDTLSLGILAFGPEEEWLEASDINVNYLLDHFAIRLRENDMHLTESLASYILARRAADVSDSRFEYSVTFVHSEAP